VFLGLAPAASEGHDPWVDFLADLTNRGLRSPVLVISDGAPGLVSAAEHTFPAALRQRCLVHRVRNVLAKVPVHAQAEVKAAYWQIFDNIELPAGQAAVEEATRRAVAFTARYERTYPAAVACLTSTLPSSRCICGSPPSTGSGSATPTC
jgi:putative transposase